MKLTDFDRFDIAGFNIAAHMTADGKYQLKNKIIDDFPETIYFNGATYNLEDIQTYKEGDSDVVFVNAIYA